MAPMISGRVAICHVRACVKGRKHVPANSKGVVCAKLDRFAEEVRISQTLGSLETLLGATSLYSLLTSAAPWIGSAPSVITALESTVAICCLHHRHLFLASGSCVALYQSTALRP